MSHLKSFSIKKITIYDFGNPDTGLGQAPTCGGLKVISRIQTLFYIEVIISIYCGLLFQLSRGGKYLINFLKIEHVYIYPMFPVIGIWKDGKEVHVIKHHYSVVNVNIEHWKNIAIRIIKINKIKTLHVVSYLFNK